MIKSAVSTAAVHVDHVRQELTIQTKHSNYNNGLCSYFYSCANVCLLIIDHHYVFLRQGQAPHPIPICTESHESLGIAVSCIAQDNSSVCLKVVLRAISSSTMHLYCW